MWKKLVTRESTLLERTLRFAGYFEFLPEPFTVRQKDLLVVYKRGMSTQYTKNDDFDSKVETLKNDLETIGFGQIIEKWDHIFDHLVTSSNKLVRTDSRQDWMAFEMYYKQSRAIILYSFNLAKFLKQENDTDIRIAILQKYYDEAEVKSSNAWTALRPFLEKVKNSKTIGDEIYSYSSEEFFQLLEKGVKMETKVLQEREEVTVIKLENYQYDIYFGDEANKVISELNIEDEVITPNSEIRGNPAFMGKARGKVVIVTSEKDYKKIQTGDVLVTTMTTPAMVSYLSKVVAIITDEGGILCHASIISRELKKPCLIGTKIATKVLKDGMLVEVDADKGIVKILDK